MGDTESFTFYSWPHPIHDAYEQEPNGLYSRVAWLPTLGPTAWILWGTIATPLTITNQRLVWDAHRLAATIGLRNPRRPASNIGRSLQRLDRFGLARQQGSLYLVRTSAPPVRPRALDHLPAAAVELHTRIFGITPAAKDNR